MYAEVAWVLVSLGTQIQPHIALKPAYFSHYVSVSYDYAIYYLHIYIQLYRFYHVNR